jgi:hypothetical protein
VYTTLKMVVVATMPIPRDTTAIMVTAGSRRKLRTAKAQIIP